MKSTVKYISLLLAVLLMVGTVCGCGKKEEINTESDLQSSQMPEPEPEPEPEKLPEFVTAEPDYFEDALFIGDSRTVGFKTYGKIPKTDFFCSVGLNVYRVVKGEKVEVKDEGKISLEELLEKKDYGKVYIMFGINELGYPSMKSTVNKFNSLIEIIKQHKPDAAIFVSACIHVTETRAKKDEKHGNKKVNSLNEELELLCDGKTVFYVNPNEIFDNENGALSSEYSSDGIHLSGKCYPLLAEYLLTKAIIFN